MYVHKVSIRRLSERAIVPSYGSRNAAGADLYALIEGELTLEPGQTALIHTGWALEIPEGYVGLVCARSGLATKKGLAPANKVGVIDADYRGECMVPLHNHSAVPQTIADGERIAQLLIMPVAACEFVEADQLSDTQRGAGGFGSTGSR